MVKRTKVWCPIFCPGTLRRGKGGGKQLDGAEAHKIPGDAEATETHAVTAASVKMFQQEACAMQASLQLKYPFMKRALVNAWNRECTKKKFRRVTVTERAECMRRVLEDVAKQLGKATLNEQHTAAEFLGKRVSRV